MAADIIDKATGAVEQSALDSIDLDSASIVRLDMSRDAVVALEKSEKDLLVRLADGQVIRVADFYERFDGRDNNLILREADGTQWLAQSSSRFPRFSLLNDLDELIGAAGSAGAAGSSLVLPAILGGVGLAGVAAATSGGGRRAR